MATAITVITLILLLFCLVVESVRIPAFTSTLPGCKEGVFTNRRQLQLFTRHWPAKSSTDKGDILMIHGFGWHSGYFFSIAEYLSALGYNVFSFDLVSHGKSRNNFCGGYIGSFDELVQDAQDYISSFRSSPARARGSRKPLYVFGESIGGTIALLLSLKPIANDAVSGLVLSAPVLKVSQNVLPPPPVVAVVRFLSNLFPKIKMPAQELDSTFDQAFGNQEYAAYARKDPLVVFDPPRLKTAAQILSTCGKMGPKLYAKLNIPVLILHGKNDKRTEYENSVDVYNSCSSKVKQLRLYDGMTHQLLQETDRNLATVKRDLKTWLKQISL